MPRTFRPRYWLVLMAMALVTALPAAAHASEVTVGDVIPGRYIVTVDDGARPAAVARGRGATPVVVLTRAINGFVAELTPAQVALLNADPTVERIEPDRVVSILETQTQTPATWGLDRIDQVGLPLSGTYSYDTTGAGVTAYIIDTGILGSHTEFIGRISAGYTAITDGKGTTDCNGHGTHVAGTVGGTTYGVAKDVTLVPVRVLDCAGSGSISGVIAGVNWVIGNHAAGAPAVANMSLGGGASSSLDSAVASAVADGVTFAVAAGNSNADACRYSPARAASAITVGATTSTDARASYSNYGSCLDVFAPGSSITAAWYTSTTATATISGTSMATPHVAGAAALLLQSDPKATPATISSRLLAQATANKVTDARTGSPNLLLSTVPSVVSAPDAPQSLTATAPLSGTVNLSWQAPAFTGGTGVTITKYTLDYSTDGATWSAPVDSLTTSLSVTGLTDGTAYTFRVAAVNSAAIVGATAAIIATPTAPAPAATAPAPPTIVSAVGGNAKATVTWTAPASDGGSSITGYTATATLNGSIVPMARCTTDSTLRSCTISSLKNGTSYSVSVTASNAVGVSAASGSLIVTPSKGGPRTAAALESEGLLPETPTVSGAARLGNNVQLRILATPGTRFEIFLNGKKALTTLNAAPKIRVRKTSRSVFRVRAVNAIGTSQFSKPVVATRATVRVMR